MSVVDCDPTWPETYEAEVSELRAVLGDEAIRTSSNTLHLATTRECIPASWPAPPHQAVAGHR